MTKKKIGNVFKKIFNGSKEEKHSYSKIPAKPVNKKVYIEEDEKNKTSLREQIKQMMQQESISCTNIVIVLYENTAELKAYEEALKKYVACNSSKSGKVILISYGEKVNKIRTFCAEEIFSKNFFDEETFSDKKCFYDALMCLSEVIKENMFYAQKKITVTGMGTCHDNVGNFSKEEAIKNFTDAVKGKSEITTKYICLSAENLVDAAETGFHLNRMIS